LYPRQYIYVDYYIKYAINTYMNKLMSALVALFAMCAVSLADAGTQDDGGDVSASGAALAAVDVVLVRPVTFVGTAVGFVGFAATSPFTAMAGVAQDTWKVLVQAPAEYTLDRDLGDFR
jgi:hypothetical protein